MNVQPVISDVADLFWWKTTKTIASNAVGANTATDVVKTLPNSFFVFCAWRGSTNYDAAQELRALVGAGPAAATALYPAAVPSNFKAKVKRNNRVDMMDEPMTQAQLCSSGYRAGQQVPIPVIYPALTQFNFTLYNTAEVLFTAADQRTVIPLRIDFGLFGYNVPVSQIDVFLNEWPALYGKAMNVLTGISKPRLA